MFPRLPLAQVPALSPQVPINSGIIRSPDLEGQDLCFALSPAEPNGQAQTSLRSDEWHRTHSALTTHQRCGACPNTLCEMATGAMLQARPLQHVAFSAAPLGLARRGCVSKLNAGSRTECSTAPERKEVGTGTGRCDVVWATSSCGRDTEVWSGMLCCGDGPVMGAPNRPRCTRWQL